MSIGTRKNNAYKAARMIFSARKMLRKSPFGVFASKKMTIPVIAPGRRTFIEHISSSSSISSLLIGREPWHIFAIIK
ncbi:MAG TPA: hypothetical protein VLB83_01640 [Candidatus Paceibacterota bacterium]|nr:hypothetical protein [Candidatus Paceibacterota bacterium]